MRLRNHDFPRVHAVHTHTAAGSGCIGCAWQKGTGPTARVNTSSGHLQPRGRHIFSDLLPGGFGENSGHIAINSRTKSNFLKCQRKTWRTWCNVGSPVLFLASHTLPLRRKREVAHQESAMPTLQSRKWIPRALMSHRKWQPVGLGGPGQSPNLVSPPPDPRWAPSLDASGGSWEVERVCLLVCLLWLARRRERVLIHHLLPFKHSSCLLLPLLEAFHSNYLLPWRAGRTQLECPPPGVAPNLLRGAQAETGHRLHWTPCGACWELWEERPELRVLRPGHSKPAGGREI